MQKVHKYIPQYAVVPMFLSVAINFIAYYGGRVLSADFQRYDLTIFLDYQIPFFSPMIIIYVLAYASWIIGYIMICRENKALCYEIMSANQIAKILCFVVFMILPTTMVRAEIIGNSIFDNLTRIIYALDSPDNLFPSIHCLENWFCFRGALRCQKVTKGYKIAMFVMAILVFASTVMVKQHVVVDILGGILTAEIGLFLSKIFGGSKIYYTLERRLRKNEEKR